MEEKKKRALLRAVRGALREELKKDVGRDVKPLLTQVDRMLALKKNRAEIENMMTEEIIKCMGKRMKQLRFVPT